jgi:hypothetical protein
VSTRFLSYTEVSRAMTCQAQHDFAYGDQLAGSSLKPKAVAPLLSGGKAWGAAVAAFHSTLSGSAAIDALKAALEEDADRQREFGVHDPDHHEELLMRLLRILAHYIDTTEPWKADEYVEHKLVVPIPSRSGKGVSSRYKLLSYVDATRQIDGRPWLVEFKLRSQLTSVEFIQLSRQIRLYAWAWWQATGTKPAGVEVHERLNEPPHPPRMVQGRKKSDAAYVPSHAKNQLCTPDAYIAACQEHGVDWQPETAEALRSRRWHQVVPIIFRDGELEEAGREMVSAAKLIRDLDSGELYPVRNSKPQNCRGCAFKDICPAPDNGLVDALYERLPPKREREEEIA